jgi:hypothetical protein
MSSVAYASQPDFSKVVLFALAARYHGHNNGDLSLTIKDARALGVGHPWKLYAGLNLLNKADLIEYTRQGKLERGTKLCSLFALTWRGVDKAPDGVVYDACVSVCPIPSNRWARWEQPEDWAKTVRHVTTINHGQKKDSKLIAERKRISVSTSVGKGRSTSVGTEGAKTDQLAWVKEQALSAPTVVDTSKTLGGGLPRTGHGEGDCQPAPGMEIDSGTLPKPARPSRRSKIGALKWTNRALLAAGEMEQAADCQDRTCGTHAPSAAANARDMPLSSCPKTPEFRAIVERVLAHWSQKPASAEVSDVLTAWRAVLAASHPSIAPQRHSEGRQLCTP